MEFIPEAVFSPDGASLLTANINHTARLWDIPVPGAADVVQDEGTWHAKLFAEARLPFSLENVAWSPDGRFFAASQQDGLVCVFEFPFGHSQARTIRASSNRRRLVLSPDGNHLLARGPGSTPDPLERQVVQTATGAPSGSVIRTAGPVVSGAFSPDGRRLMTVCLPAEAGSQKRIDSQEQPGRIQFWDWGTGTETRPAIETPSPPLDVDSGASGVAAAVCADGRILVIDSVSSAIPRTVDPGKAEDLSLVDGWSSPTRLVRFASDGTSFVTFGLRKAAQLWGSANGEPLCPPLQHDGRCVDASFSPDGRFVATAAFDNTARVWEARTGKPAGATLRHTDWVFEAEFNPDGALLVTACADGAANVWDRRTGRLVGPPLELGCAVRGAKFAIDGRCVVTLGSKGIARVWEWQSGRPVSAPVPLFEAGKCGFGKCE